MCRGPGRFGLVCVVTALLFAVPTAEASPECARFASPDGSDAAAGSEESPYRSVQRLADSLTPGQTGCLRGGTYSEDQVTLSIPGTTLRSYPGERAGLVGRLRVTGDRVGVVGLELDGRNSANLPSPTINAD